MTQQSTPPVIGFIGTGHIATFHSKMLRRSGVQIVRGSCYDIDIKRAEIFAQGSGSTVVDSEQSVIDSSDLVYICTWTSEHQRLVSMCISAGKPYFCEKPLGIDFRSADAMNTEANKAQLTHQCGLILRRSPAYLWAKELIDDQSAGAPMAVVFRDDQFIPIQGHYKSTWRADITKAGAGTLLEHSIHDVDMLRFLIGDISAVSARATYRHQIPGIEDVVAATVQFTNGAVGTLTTIWHDNLSRSSLRNVEIFCERRTIVISGDDWFGPVTWTNADGSSGCLQDDELLEKTVDLALVHPNPDAAFVLSAIAKTNAYPDFSIALEAHRVVEAMYESARHNGTSINVAEIK